MPRIYTKTGDDGTTGLLYGGRVPKDDLVTEAYGTTDEAVAVLGLARSLTSEPAMAEEILALQRELFVVGADLAANPDQRAKLAEGVSIVTAAMTERLEARIDALVAERPLPAGLHRAGRDAVERRPRRGPQHDPAGRAGGGRARTRPARRTPRCAATSTA